MSTKSSLLLWKIPTAGIHLYQEFQDNTVRLDWYMRLFSASGSGLHMPLFLLAFWRRRPIPGAAKGVK